MVLQRLLELFQEEFERTYGAKPNIAVYVHWNATAKLANQIARDFDYVPNHHRLTETSGCAVLEDEEKRIKYHIYYSDEKEAPFGVPEPVSV